ncbi:hypothetical protein C8R44DRAFT_716405 [Mycena epipterygia]|nr:hypothetical protein C8R44DRAFT_716405 [Mycena epipterygia]
MAERSSAPSVSVGWRIDSPSGLSCSLPTAIRTSPDGVPGKVADTFGALKAADKKGPEGALFAPRYAAEGACRIPNPRDVGCRYFPTWFASGYDALDAEFVQEMPPKDDDPQRAARFSAGCGQDKNRSIPQNVQVSVMAVRVETPQNTPVMPKDNVKAAPGKSAHRKSGKGENRQQKNTKDGPAYFSRPPSQLPEGGWFRATTSQSPLDSSDSSKPSSSSENESSSEQSSSAARKKARKIRKKYKERKRDRKNQKRVKEALRDIKIKHPFEYNGEPDIDVFDQWTYEVDTWIALNGLSDRLALKLLVNFMSGPASKFFMVHVATNQERWTVKDVYTALFDNCFPMTVRDFARVVKSLAKRLPDMNERQLVQIFWDGVEQYVRVKLLDRGMSPDDSSLKNLVKWAVRFESANKSIENELQLETYLTDESQSAKKPSRSSGPSKKDKGKASIGAVRLSSNDGYSSEAFVVSKWNESSDSESVSEEGYLDEDQAP